MEIEPNEIVIKSDELVCHCGRKLPWDEGTVRYICDCGCHWVYPKAICVGKGAEPFSAIDNVIARLRKRSQRLSEQAKELDRRDVKPVNPEQVENVLRNTSDFLASIAGEVRGVMNDLLPKRGDGSE